MVNPVTVDCEFCSTPLEEPKNRKYTWGDRIECVNCGRLNLYEIVIEKAKQKLRQRTASV